MSSVIFRIAPPVFPPFLIPPFTSPPSLQPFSFSLSFSPLPLATPSSSVYPLLSFFSPPTTSPYLSVTRYDLATFSAPFFPPLFALPPLLAPCYFPFAFPVLSSYTRNAASVTFCLPFPLAFLLLSCCSSLPSPFTPLQFCARGHCLCLPTSPTLSGGLPLPPPPTLLPSPPPASLHPFSVRAHTPFAFLPSQCSSSSPSSLTSFFPHLSPALRACRR